MGRATTLREACHLAVEEAVDVGVVDEVRVCGVHRAVVVQRAGGACAAAVGVAQRRANVLAEQRRRAQREELGRCAANRLARCEG
jgi:hypothetical protein